MPRLCQLNLSKKKKPNLLKIQLKLKRDSQRISLQSLLLKKKIKNRQQKWRKSLLKILSYHKHKRTLPPQKPQKLQAALPLCHQLQLLKKLDTQQLNPNKPRPLNQVHNQSVAAFRSWQLHLTSPPLSRPPQKYRLTGQQPQTSPQKSHRMDHQLLSNL